MPLLPILRKSPFARLFFFYAAGIAVANGFTDHCYTFPGLPCLLLLLWILLILIVSLYRSFHTGWVSGSLAALIIFLCGIWSAGIHCHEAEKVRSLPVFTGTYRIRIIDLPENSEKRVKAMARVLAVQADKRWEKLNIRIMVYLNRDSCTPRIDPGMELFIHAPLKNIQGPGNPGEFDYRRYLEVRHVYRQAFVRFDDWSFCGSSTGRSPRAMASVMRMRLLQCLEKIGLEPSDYGLLSALTLGYKEDLDTRTKQVFSRAGVMHIMALSGFNVGIIALVISFLMGFYDSDKTGKAGKTIFIILFLWLFAFVTGLSASVTRATAMISFVLAGRLFHRQINTYNILFASALLLLAISPGMLTDVSFQLSFAAVAGIILYQPVLHDLIKFRNKLIIRIWQVFTTACAAQLSTLPITLFYFHQFPVYFWLTNLYVIPLVSVIICFAGVYLAVAFVKPLAMLLGKLLAVLLKVLFFSVAIVEELPFSLISGIYINGYQAGILILLILFLALFILFRQAGSFLIFLSLASIFMALHALYLMKLEKQGICMVGNVRGETAITIISGRSAVLLLNSETRLKEAQQSFAFGNFWIAHGVRPSVYDLDSIDYTCSVLPGLFCRTDWRGKNNLISLGKFRMIILRDNRFYDYRTQQPKNADVVIVTGEIAIEPSRLTEEIKPSLIILDSSVNSYQAAHWIGALEKMGLKYHYVVKQGAYVADL